MPLIEALELTKHYRIPVRKPGVGGAVRHLVRPQYREHVAVDRLTLAIDEGEAVAYLGRNGAGKSTTIKMMTGILVPTSGRLTVAGLVPHADRVRHVRAIGAVFGQRSQLWPDLPTAESFDALRAIYRVSRADYERTLRTLEEMLELGPILGTPVRKLSLGQRMRADLAAALLHRPRVLFLDEPTIGLDVDVKARIRTFVRELVEQEGVTVMLTTHDLADIEDIAERVTLIDEGRVIFDGSKRELVAALGEARVVSFALARPLDDEGRRRLAEALPPGAMADGSGEDVLQLTLPADVAVPRVIAAVLDTVAVTDVSIAEPSIEGVVRKLYAERHVVPGPTHG